MDIIKFSSFILENIDNNIEIIEDCFLEFCDDYNQDIVIDKGYFVSKSDINNGTYVPAVIINDILLLAKEENIEIKHYEVYQVVLMKKEHRYDSTFGREVNSKNWDLTSVWKDTINTDYKKAIKKVESLSNNKLKSTKLDEILPSFWQITIFFEII